MLSVVPFLKKNSTAAAFSQHLFRIFPATEKDFFAIASHPNKEKMRHRSE